MTIQDNEVSTCERKVSVKYMRLKIHEQIRKIRTHIYVSKGQVGTYFGGLQAPAQGVRGQVRSVQCFFPLPGLICPLCLLVCYGQFVSASIVLTQARGVILPRYFLCLSFLTQVREEDSARVFFVLIFPTACRTHIYLKYYIQNQSIGATFPAIQIANNPCQCFHQNNQYQQPYQQHP